MYRSWVVPVPASSTAAAREGLEVTRLLRAVEGGDVEAKEQLFTALYGELKRIATAAMHGQGPEHTLQPTALVNEAYLRVMRASNLSFADSQHFFRTAAVAMRHLLVDHARKKKTDKRDGRVVNVGLDSVVEMFEDRSQSLEDLDEALTEFARLDPVMAEAIELRFFAGMSEVEVAKAVGLKLRTFQRRWLATRHYLRTQLEAS